MRRGSPAGDEAEVRDAVSVVKAWLGAFSELKHEEMSQRTHYPFHYATTNRVKKCDGDVKTVSQLRALIVCVSTRDKLFFEELQHNVADIELEVVEHAKVFKSLSSAVDEPASHERIVQTFINGDGITFLIAGIVAPIPGADGGLRSLVVHGEVPEME